MPYIVTAKRPCPDCGGDTGPADGPLIDGCPCAACNATGERVSRRAVATLDEANIAAYEVAPPTMCDRCESPNAPWQFSRHLGSPFPAGRWCDCDGGQVDPIPVAGPDRADYLDIRTLFSLPESGGTIGPLLDGTVIGVEVRSWADLRERAGLDRDGLALDRQTLDAYNARQAS